MKLRGIRNKETGLFVSTGFTEEGGLGSFNPDVYEEIEIENIEEIEFEPKAETLVEKVKRALQDEPIERKAFLRSALIGWMQMIEEGSISQEALKEYLEADNVLTNEEKAKIREVLE